MLRRLLILGLLGLVRPALADPLFARMAADVEAGRPLVAHVVVALADNVHQGIVPIPAALGDGASPRTNLYWGARYGTRTFLVRDGGWRVVKAEGALPPGVLERVVLSRKVRRGGREVDAFVVADAWRGDRIREAIAHFLELAAGHHVLRLPRGDTFLEAGGAAHVLAFVGHNGLMEFPLPVRPTPRDGAPARGAVVLACASGPYFGAALEAAGAQVLVTTTGLMAPEGYVLDAALTRLFAGEDARAARGAAAQAYDRYQKCGRRAARRLFSAD